MVKRKYFCVICEVELKGIDCCCPDCFKLKAGELEGWEDPTNILWLFEKEHINKEKFLELRDFYVKELVKDQSKKDMEIKKALEKKYGLATTNPRRKK